MQERAQELAAQREEVQDIIRVKEPQARCISIDPLHSLSQSLHLLTALLAVQSLLCVCLVDNIEWKEGCLLGMLFLPAHGSWILVKGKSTRRL